MAPTLPGAPSTVLDVPKLIAAPVRVEAAGSKPKLIDEYVAVCLPAFTPDTVHRDDD
jgi:hypothetical protein